MPVNIIPWQSLQCVQVTYRLLQDSIILDYLGEPKVQAQGFCKESRKLEAHRKERSFKLDGGREA